MTAEITSVGIDIGTTTTHLVVSRLTLGDMGNPGEVPRRGIVARSVVHRGAVRLTPLRWDNLARECAGADVRESDTTVELDLSAVEGMLREEYARAGLVRGQVASGAVLVTGETARAANAQAVVAAMADLAGGFVAAAAGPNLESVLAGRGSGAAEHSRRFGRRVLNIDIGGGTANFAWFARGRATHTACLRVGGRHITTDGAGRVRTMTPVGRWAAAVAGWPLTIGQQLTAPAASAVARMMAQAVGDGIAGHWSRTDGLVITAPVGEVAPPELVIVSGGVGQLMGEVCSPADATASSAPPGAPYGDLGGQLATALVSLLGPPHGGGVDAEERLPAEDGPWPSWRVADEALRATVIGAGLHATQISGQTLWCPVGAQPLAPSGAVSLPLLNVPVVRAFRWAGELVGHPDGVVGALRAAAAQGDIDLTTQPVALWMPSLLSLDLTALTQLAATLAQAARTLKMASPLVIIMADNLAARLGRLVAESLAAPVLAVDEIDAQEADYIDFGCPRDGQLPVVVKTLAFA